MQTALGLDDLRLVRALGDTGALGRAAAQLSLHHSSAFRRLGALEARLGTRLFVRSRDGYRPTPAGEAAIAAAAELLGGLEALDRRLAGEDLRPSGTVRLTTADTLLDEVAAMLAAFRAEEPQIDVELIVSNAFFSLTRRDADIAIRPSAQVPEHLVGRRLTGLAVAPYASPAYLASVPRREPLERMAWLAPDDSLSHLGSARWIAREVDAARVVLRANTLPALAAAARAGLGVAPLPCYLGDADPALRRAAAPLEAMATALWLLTHPDLRRVARLQALRDFAAHWFTARAARFEGRRRARRRAG